MEAHVEAECEYPGHTFELSHWPPAEFWSLSVVCGPSRIEIVDFTAGLS